MFAIKKCRNDEWLMFQPGGRLDHWSGPGERVEFNTLAEAKARRRVENADHYADVVKITSNKTLTDYEVVDPATPRK